MVQGLLKRQTDKLIIIDWPLNKEILHEIYYTPSILQRFLRGRTTGGWWMRFYWSGFTGL